MFKIYDGREHFYQWDLDRKLIIEDPSVIQVHFCNRTDNCSLVCETYVEDGITLVNVPNILLQTDWKIHVYAYDGKHTKFAVSYDVASRTKPADYAYTETEILNWSKIDEEVAAALEEAQAATIRANEATANANDAALIAQESANNASYATINALDAAAEAKAATEYAMNSATGVVAATDNANAAANSVVVAITDAELATQQARSAAEDVQQLTEDAINLIAEELNKSISATDRANEATKRALDAGESAEKATTDANTATQEAIKATADARELIDVCSIVNEATGTSIYLSDSAELPLEGLSVDKEDTTIYVTGNNLFNPTVISAKANEEIKTGNYGSIDSTKYDGEIKLTSPRYTYNPNDKSDYTTNFINGLFYIWLDEAFLPISENGETYTFIADVVIDERHNNIVSGEPAPNLIGFTGTGGGISSTEIIITGTTEDGKEKGKLIGIGKNKYKKTDGVIDYSQQNRLEIRTVGKSITFTKIMLLPGDWTNNPPEYEDYKGQVITNVEDYKNYHTYYPKTRIVNDADVTVSVKYKADTKNYIDNKFAELQQAIISTGGNV